MKHLKTIFITLLLGLALAFSAHADTPTPPEDNSLLGWAKSTLNKAMGINFDTNVSVSEQLSKLSGVKDAVAGVVDNANPFDEARTTAKNITASLGAPAVTLWLALSVIVLCWSGLKIIGGEDLGELIDAMITITFFGLLVNQYDQIFGEYLPKFFTTWGDTIYSATTGGTSSGTVGNAAGAMVELLFAVIMKILTATVENIVTYFFMFTAIFLLFTGPALYRLGMAAVTVAATFMIANGIAAIAIALGPIAVALGVLPWTRQIFTAWLALLTASFGIKVIAAATLPVLTFFSAQMSGLGNITGSQSGVGVGGFFGAGAIKDIILIMIYAEVLSTLVGMMPELARAIFGGVMHGYGGGRSGGGYDKAKQTAGEMKDSAINSKNAAIKVGMKVLSKGAM